MSSVRFPHSSERDVRNVEAELRELQMALENRSYEADLLAVGSADALAVFRARAEFVDCFVEVLGFDEGDGVLCFVFEDGAA